MSQSLKIVSVLGTRPEIIKLSPLLPRLPEVCDRSIIVHSGQHYSYEMEAQFFEELHLPSSDYSLKAGAEGRGAGEQTALMLARLEPILQAEQPALVIVQGDTNTTLAGALVAAKLGLPVLHLEAGCRSFNRAMPEEINRVMVDHISHILLAPDHTAMKNLLNEGCDRHAALHLVGSTAIEACQRCAEFALHRPLLSQLDKNLRPGGYLAVTLHRAENTTPQVLPGLVQTLNQLAADWPIVFPVHPRTQLAIRQNGLHLDSRIITIPPLGYLDMLSLVYQAQALLTDSGGLQEEAAALNTPVLVLREETEWSYLVEAGKTVLVGNAYPQTIAAARAALQPTALETMRAATFDTCPDVTQAILNIIRAFLHLGATPHAAL